MYRVAVDLTIALERFGYKPTPTWVTETDTAMEQVLQRHRREDRLPRERALVLRDILDASGIRDHDSAEADERYLAWKRGGRKGPKPTAKLGGMLDAFNASKDGIALSCLVEGFEQEVRGMKTWREVAEILPVIAEAIGCDSVRLPDDVLTRHVAHDVEINGGCDAE